MKRLWLVLATLLLLPVRVRAVDFDTEVMPVLTRFACNSGACHGAAAGRGGLRLSLYGSNPAFDFESLTVELEGRRVNRVRHDESLILLKPTESLNHGGGMRFELDSEPAKLLLNWIREGAGRESVRQLRSLKVEPTSFVARRVGDSVRLRTTARFDDGSEKDVTHWTVFKAEDDSAVELPGAGSARLLRKGRHVVTARFLDRVLPVELIVPLNERQVDLSKERRASFIDDAINQKLETLRIPPSPPAGDDSFLRRARISLTGRLPSPREVVAFLEDDHPAKRAKLIERLVESDDFTTYWTFRLSQWLRIRTSPQDDTAARVYFKWVRSQLKQRVPYDRLARTLLLATGDTHEAGPPSFYRAATDARTQAEFTSELFMGARLRCANCHDHPLDRWTQDDYHGLAAVFARIKRGRVVAIESRGDVIHPRTQEPARIRIPGERFLDETSDGRKELADWLTSPDNPYFARAIVNRLWKAVMGRGLVEPADDLRATNPATHPELLDRLADDFVKNGCDLRNTVRLICSSHAWQRSSRTVNGNESDDRFYSHAIRQPLEPEVLADAVFDVTGLPQKYGNEPAGTRAIELFAGNIPARSLDILGRCVRDGSCESGAAAAGGLPRALHLVNGEFLNQRLANRNAHLHQRLKAGATAGEIIDEYYLRSLSRKPSTREREFWTVQFNGAVSSEERRQLAEDFVWSLLTCEEFTTNH